MNLTNDISKQLIINSLPNENPKYYAGESLQVMSQLITPKNIKNYLG